MRLDDMGRVHAVKIVLTDTQARELFNPNFTVSDTRTVGLSVLATGIVVYTLDASGRFLRKFTLTNGSFPLLDVEGSFTLAELLAFREAYLTSQYGSNIPASAIYPTFQVDDLVDG